MKGKLIVFDSIDHSGKTTISKYLVEHLNSRGISAIYTRQPSDEDIKINGKQLRDECKYNKNFNSITNLFCFLMDRTIHIRNTIIPALENGSYVVCDRWWFSTVAYQFYGEQIEEKYNLSSNFKFEVNKLASQFLTPDYAFCLVRDKKMEDNQNDKFESQDDDFKKRVQVGYKELIKLGYLTESIVYDDKDKTLDAIMEKING